MAVTLKQILDDLPCGTPPGRDFEIAVDSHFKASLSEAINLYTKSRGEALSLLYKSKELNQTRPLEVEADFEEVAASCGHFSFSLQDFAAEITEYLDILDDLKNEVENSPKGRTWRWLKFWQRSTPEAG